MNEERTGKCLRQVKHIRDHCDKDIPYRQLCHGGDRKTFVVMTST